MADPELAIAAAVARALVAAFGDDAADVDPAVRTSQHADYQVNAALPLAKRLKRPPRDVATALVDALDAGDLVERLEIAGPGFVNVTISSAGLEASLREVAADARLGVPLAASPEVVVIDYSSPNVAKEMHVGHLRSAIIGDALARLLEAAGHRVIRQNHLGDWGTPFGMLIEHILDAGIDVEASTLGTIGEAYQDARRRFDTDSDFADRARARVVLLQDGDAATRECWTRLVDLTLAEARALYQKLGVGLTDEHLAGESMYASLLAGAIQELDERGLLRQSEGALCTFPPGFTNRDGTPLPLIVRKNDGAVGYAATDLAAIRYRLRTLGATRVLVVVGAPQAQHLAMVFETAKQAGWLVPPARAEHVAFGSVLDAGGKMFRTRAGGSVKLVDLLDEAVERARATVAAKNPELDAETRDRVAHMVGIGAVKHADLSSDRVKDYVFDYDRMLAFEGNTAPYVQYAHARIHSILRKAGVVETDPAAIRIAAPAERALALALLRFPTVIARVEAVLEPHLLCTYLFDLATAFSTFYEQCPVLRAGSREVLASRLALAAVTARVLARGLALLGIEAPERM